MTEPLSVKRPWLRLIGFIPFAGLSVVVAMVVLFIFATMNPALSEVMDSVGDKLDDTPSRLMEESVYTAAFAVMVGAVAFSFLAAAAVTWQRPLKDFLWAGRRFDPSLFGCGFLIMLAISILWVPLSLATGSEWRPPVFDPYYPEHTRLIYALAMVVTVSVAAAAEEVVFRGVLLRVSGLITRHAIVLCLLNGILFSAIHLDPDPVTFVGRAISGMGWTWAALRLGGLEFAVGSHFANNLFLTLMWSPLSAAVQIRDTPWVSLIPDLITTSIIVIVVERLARRRSNPGSALPARPAA